MEFPLEHHQIRTNGLLLHVVQCGPTGGALVVLLHGFPEFWYGWRHQLQALAAAGCRVWAPDQRGYNLSDKLTRTSDYRIEQLGADVLGLLDAADTQKAMLVGHDWGAAVVWWLAEHHPERLQRVAVLNVPHPAVLGRVLRHRPRQLLKSWYLFFFQVPWLPEQLFRRRAFRFGRRALRGTSRPGTFSSDDLRHYVRAWAQPGALTGMLNWYRAAFRHTRASAPSRLLTVPVRILWGRKDAFLVPELAQASLELCENGRLTYFDEATHWLHHEEPAAVNRLLLEFLQGESVPVVS
ncbi:alpha/beta fold hydrolase [Hymenobacter psychrotolerans]|uniref:Pimeloyl-ACP methyl ester carboxylesterase n=1 Tax=Hymenobacter psychrotolerans DSM 18569 TaxID=1121959 RepID=A0A1M7FV76_9BACT|nr:alpha/beta hydrolase [Hymenobacter psychrotolerans]SHM08032.1 Pimeloyl-ACP methyl ester carboxylesterase [Hymenobacter psychrotolerans DSM 18569]